MISFFMENLSTIIISILLLAAVLLVIRKMRNDKKAGKSLCGCSCSGCDSVCMCHTEKSTKKTIKK